MANSLVIIPTYNEKENIERLLVKIFSLDRPFDVLVIDDNSPDGTAAAVRALQPQFAGRLYMMERREKLGLGTAYIAGFKWALLNNYSYIFEMDADFSHNPDDLIRLYDACAVDRADVAIGSRYKSGVNVVNWPMRRVLLSYLASVYVRFITRMDIRDTTAGFACFKSHVLEAIDLDRVRFKGYAFQIEMKFAAWKMGFTLREVPIIFTDRTEGVSKMSGGIFNEALPGVLSMKIKSSYRKYEHKQAPEEQDRCRRNLPQ